MRLPESFKFHIFKAPDLPDLLYTFSLLCLNLSNLSIQKLKCILCLSQETRCSPFVRVID